MSDDLRLYWSALIRRSVAFEPEDRPESAEAFADELETLLEEEPLHGEIPLKGGPGELRRNIELQPDAACANEVAWVVTDYR